ncbi:hypothetical protein EB796_009891 [Bugula neritina]|uniref:Complex 1 LYR protein domain-containing protein n=1 Tax=Bugula neritina TaxID=10212 RepID=A0A7J7K0M4_BUGNE|nr:hypothetical protein EB796_009891 [Bugula neritina]
MVSRIYVLSLYHKLLREGSKFHNYNFREYTLRRTRDAFKVNKSETDPTKMKSLVEEAEKNLAMLQRQVMLGNAFSHESVMNREFSKTKTPPT